MALKITLPKASNHLYYDFVDAYFVVESVSFYDENGESKIHFEFNGYPSREARKVDGVAIPTESAIPFGGAFYPIYSTKIYQWAANLAAEMVFPEGIPVSIDARKTVLYNTVKEMLDESGIQYEDIFEEGQNPYMEV